MEDLQPRTKAVERVYSELRNRIWNRELAPGQQMLERDLALMLNVSRTPIREALVRLEKEGFVEIIPRHGMRVKELSALEVQQIEEILATLEYHAAAALARQNLPADKMRALDDAISAMDEATIADNIIEWSEADYRFHRLLISLCNNPFLSAAAGDLLDRAHRFRLRSAQLNHKPVASNIAHASLVEAIRRGDPESAVEIHRTHKERVARQRAVWLSTLTSEGRG